MVGGDGPSSSGSGQAAVAPQSSGGSGSGVSASPSRKRKDLAGPDADTLRCDFCHKLCKNQKGWALHLGKSTLCAEAGAECEPYDPTREVAAKHMKRVDDAVYASAVQAKLLEGYGALQFDRLVDRTAIQSGVKEGIVEPLMEQMKQEIYRRLERTGADRTTLEQQIGAVFDVHAGPAPLSVY